MLIVPILFQVPSLYIKKKKIEQSSSTSIYILMLETIFSKEFFKFPDRLCY